ncbi:MAG: hypothetical protein HN368_21360 [Spirochaetales bacterium]|jgi:hypothetical protein|nr:hypothetical protein [Spirochaetales bacterium]
MNITLSADEKLIREARAYAKANNTSLNQLVRDYLSLLVNKMSTYDAADAFAAVALESSGRSADGWKFDRNTIHRYDDGDRQE